MVKEEALCSPLATLPVPEDSAEDRSNPKGSLSFCHLLCGDAYVQTCVEKPWHRSQCRSALSSPQYITGTPIPSAYLLVTFREALTLFITRPSSGLRMNLMIPLFYLITFFFFFFHNEAKSSARKKKKENTGVFVAGSKGFASRQSSYLQQDSSCTGLQRSL